MLPDMRLIREACWREEALKIRYSDKAGTVSERDILPLAIVYVDNVLVLQSWCCLRKDFRMFRAERITSVQATGNSFRPRRVAMLRMYLDQLLKRSEV